MMEDAVTDKSLTILIPVVKKKRTSERKLISKEIKNTEENACPLCGIALLKENFDQHYKTELDRILSSTEPNSSDSSSIGGPTTKEPEKRSSKRASALHARKKVMSQLNYITTGKPDDQPLPNEILKVVRNNRARRAELQSNGNLSNNNVSPKSVIVTSIPDEQQNCFLCGEILYGDLEAINAHVDSCLNHFNNINNNSSSDANLSQSKSNRSSTSFSSSKGKRRARSESAASAAVDHNSQYQDDDFEVYSISGQTRIRVCTMGDGYLGLRGSNPKPKQQDVDGDLDIDDDDTQKFGPSQYSNMDLPTFENGDALGLSSDVYKNWTETETDSNSSRSSPHVPSSLAIECLREKIRQLEKNQVTVPKCLICLEPYKTPVVSIGCWHVHCEKCWLLTLGSKKLCPQCQQITSAADLRKIYV